MGVASHNLYDVALAHLLAERRGVSAALDVEMLQGMSPAQARAVKAAVGTVLLYTPVVAPEDFDVAVAYLVRRLEENAQPQNFLYALFADEAATPTGEPAMAGTMADQEARFRASVEAMSTTSQLPRRTADRPPAGHTFANTTDSDPALPSVRRWAAERVAAVCSGTHVARAHLRRRRRPRGRGRSRRPTGLGSATGIRAGGHPAACRGRAGGPPRRPRHGDGGRGRQDGRRGRPRGLRGDRLRPLLRRPGARARAVRRARRHRRGAVRPHRR